MGKEERVIHKTDRNGLMYSIRARDACSNAILLLLSPLPFVYARRAFNDEHCGQTIITNESLQNCLRFVRESFALLTLQSQFFNETRSLFFKNTASRSIDVSYSSSVNVLYKLSILYLPDLSCNFKADGLTS